MEGLWIHHFQMFNGVEFIWCVKRSLFLRFLKFLVLVQSPYLQRYESALATLLCWQEALSVPSSLLLRVDHPSPSKKGIGYGSFK